MRWLTLAAGRRAKFAVLASAVAALASLAPLSAKFEDAQEAALIKYDLDGTSAHQLIGTRHRLHDLRPAHDGHLRGGRAELVHDAGGWR